MNKKTLYTLMGCALTLAAAPTITSCSDDDDANALSFANGTGNIQLYYEDTKQVELNNSNSPVFDVNDEFVCSVDDNGLITGLHVGKSTFTVTDGATITGNVEVKAKYELPMEEYFRTSIPWGSSLNTAISVLGDDYTISSDGKYYYWDNSDNTLVTSMVIEDGKVTGMGYILSQSLVAKTPNLADAMIERYELISGESSSYVFKYSGLEMTPLAIGFTIQTKAIIILYLPETTTNKSVSVTSLRDIASLAEGYDTIE